MKHKTKYAIALALYTQLIVASSLSLGESPKAVERKPFEVSIELEWQGRTVQIRKILSCDLRRRSHPGDDDTKMRDVWEQNIQRITHVLPSKEVLIFRLPGLCRTFNGGFHPHALRDDFLPTTYWLNHSDSPTEAEHIRSYRYFLENPHRRFVILGVRTGETKAANTDITDKEPGADLFASPYWPEAYFAGVNAIVFPKAVWMRFPELAKELATLKKTGTIDWKLLQRLAPVLLETCSSDAHGVGKAANCMVGPFDDRPYAVAARKEGDFWNVDYKDVGLRRYSRHLESRDLDRTGCNPSFVTCNLWKNSFRVKVADETFEFPRRGGGIVFDANNQVLVRTSFSIVGSGTEKKRAK
jgi:hypothetical protein